MNGNDLRLLRVCVSKSREEFAEMLGVSPSSIEKWEQGTRNMKKGRKEILERVFAWRNVRNKSLLPVNQLCKLLSDVSRDKGTRSKSNVGTNKPVVADGSSVAIGGYEEAD